MGLFPGQKASHTDCLILGNGPSLVGSRWTIVDGKPEYEAGGLRNWKGLPRDRVFVMGVNQSWRVVPKADAHVVVDHDQLLFTRIDAQPPGKYFPEARAYYDDMAKRGTLFLMRHGLTEFQGARALERHDALTFSRRPFQKRHRGAHTKPPRLEEDGGVVLKVGHEAGGSVCYIALQIAAAMGFERMFFIGLDISNGIKFTGTPSNSLRHDRLWMHVPGDVKAKTKVIGPSATQQFDVVHWPWGNA